MSDIAIETRALTRRFGRSTVVDRLDLVVPQGGAFGLLGRNGAGKTTTIRMLLRLLEPTSGEMRVLGLHPATAGMDLRQRLGYVPDRAALYGWMTVGQLTHFTGSLHRRWDGEHVRALLERFDLDPGQRVRELSRGMAAQLALVLAMGHRPELLILDEPATGLDVLVRRDFLESVVQVIQEEGRTVLMSSHLVHEVERVADRVGILEHGRLMACGTVDQVRDRIKKVVVRVAADGHPERVEGVLATEGDASRLVLTVVDMDEARGAQLEAAGAAVVDVIDLSLEDSFAAQVKTTGGSR